MNSDQYFDKLHSSPAVQLRTRGARYLTTLRCAEAAADLERSLKLGSELGDIYYRLGLSAYFSGDYARCMEYEEKAIGFTGEEMGIAILYWHTLAAYRLGKKPSLLEKYYHPGMDIGHHSSYERVMGFASGALSEEEFMGLLESEESDLEYPILAYGCSVWLGSRGRKKESRSLLEKAIRRDGFWIAYGYVAAWNDLYSSPAPSEGSAV